jgi:hypothetical protein
LGCIGLRRKRILPRSPLPGNLVRDPAPALMGPATAGNRSSPVRRANRLDGTRAGLRFGTRHRKPKPLSHSFRSARVPRGV